MVGDMVGDVDGNGDMVGDVENGDGDVGNGDGNGKWFGFRPRASDADSGRASDADGTRPPCRMIVDTKVISGEGLFATRSRELE
jgi:hypothetical protein